MRGRPPARPPRVCQCPSVPVAGVTCLLLSCVRHAHAHTHARACQMQVLYTTAFSACLSLVGCVVTGQLLPALAFLQRNPEVRLLLHCAASCRVWQGVARPGQRVHSAADAARFRRSPAHARAAPVTVCQTHAQSTGVELDCRALGGQRAGADPHQLDYQAVRARGQSCLSLQEPLQLEHTSARSPTVCLPRRLTSPRLAVTEALPQAAWPHVPFHQQSKDR
jgi:hypothetical protein